MAWSPCGKYLAILNEESLKLKLYCVEYLPTKAVENPHLQLVASTQIHIDREEPSSLQKVIENKMFGEKFTEITLKRASLSVALQDGKPIVGLLCKNEATISSVCKKFNILRLFQSQKKICLHYGFVQFWNPWESTNRINEKPIMLNQSTKDIFKMVKFHILLKSDASSILLSPNGKYFIYICAQELFYKTKKSIKLVKVIFLIDIQLKKVIFRVSSSTQPCNSRDTVCWSQDSEVVGINVFPTSTSSNETIILFPSKLPPMSSSKNTKSKPLKFITLKGQLLHIEWTVNNNYRAYLYKSADSTLCIHSIKHETIISEPLYSLPLINTTNATVSDSILKPVAVSLDTFDRCIFVWARKRLVPNESMCDHVVIVLPETLLPPPPSKPDSNKLKEVVGEEQLEAIKNDSTGWLSLGPRACISPNVLALEANVPESAPFALPCPIHRQSTPLIANSPPSDTDLIPGSRLGTCPAGQVLGQVEVCALSSCMRLYSPPSLRRLALRAVYATPGALEMSMLDGCVPSALVGSQFTCNSLNFGPLNQFLLKN